MDYLGGKYPLYYGNYDEAVNLLNKISKNPEMLLSTQKFLEEIRNKLHKDKFIKLLKEKINEWL